MYFEYIFLISFLLPFLFLLKLNSEHIKTKLRNLRVEVLWENQEEGNNANQVMHFQNFLYILSLQGRIVADYTMPFYIRISVLQMDKINLFRAVKNNRKYSRLSFGSTFKP